MAKKSTIEPIDPEMSRDLAIYSWRLSETLTMTTERACKLLAYLLTFGGSNEAVVMQPRLHAAMIVAKTHANIDGGEIPDWEHIKLFQQYSEECEAGTATWIEEDICKRYNIKWEPDIYLVESDNHKWKEKFRKQQTPVSPDDLRESK